jgi:hypothetical protein
VGIVHRDASVPFNIGDSTGLPASSIGSSKAHFFSCSQPDAVQDRNLVN